MAVSQEQRAALARDALAEVTDADDVGEVLAVTEVEPGVIDVVFACRLGAYTGWHWTVSTSDLPEDEATVLEVELLPGDGALLAPPWVPWTERLAEWRKQHPDERHPGEPEEGSQGDELDEDPDDDDGEDAELDEDDLTVDDELDELDETELEDDLASPAAFHGDDSDDEDGDRDDDSRDGDRDDEDDSGERGPRPADEDRSL